MTFDDVLHQVITLLKRQGRVSYPALKIRFSLDDEYLEALKAEIIEAQQLATDENDRVLVWAGNTAAISAAASPPAQTTPPPAAQGQPAPQVTPRAAASHPPDAERRQLTVMFCDLVDSTTLSSQLDPEEYREVVRAYQQVCSEVITHFDGYVAQLLGDGLLVYFGYPQAHEDDAQRAVRAGLGMLTAMGDLNTHLQREKGIQLSLRMGVHTGLVVVGEMGSTGRQEQLALGETPNIAARIQGLAAPNTLVISAATLRLVQGYFDCEALGAQSLRGVVAPLNVYRVPRESGTQSRLEIGSARGLTPLVGREQEVGLLLERWVQVKDGHGQVVLLSGDAGIGKSRLVHMLKDHVAHGPHTRWECRSSSYFEKTALFPLTDLLQRLWRFQAEDTPDTKWEKLASALSQYRLPVEETVPLLAPILSLALPANHYPPLNLSPQRQRQKTLETIVALLVEHAEHHPVLFVIEDLHWTDPTTLELLNLVIEQIPITSILMLLTCRPTFQSSWSHRSYLTEITVNRIAPHHIERMAAQLVAGKTFPDQVMQQIVEKTDGVPLFVEEMTKAILESGYLKEIDGHYVLAGALSALAIPATLQDSLMARLDHLMTSKGIAQLASVIGRQFAYGVLQAVSQVDAFTLQRELGRLVEAEIVYQRGVPPQSTYVFKHALMQDAAYESLLKSTRQQYHQRIAHVLEAQFSETTATQPELLAHHYTEAGLAEKAVPYWHKAAQRAIERSAHVEAIAHLRQGLALLATLPETPEHVQRDVEMHIALGASLMATQGYGALEVEQTYSRAQHLCQHLDDPHQLFTVLRGLWNYHVNSAEFQRAHELSKQLLDIAQRTQDTALLVAAHRALGTTLFCLATPTAALTQLTQGLALYDPQQHHTSVFRHGEDSGVICHSYAAWTLWILGYPDQGLARSQEAVTLVQQSAHPFSLGFVLSFTAVFHQFRREGRATRERSEAAMSLAMEQGFPLWVAFGSLLRGWTLAHQGQAREGIEQMSQGLTAYRATGAEMFRPYWLALLAEAHGTLGEPETGLAVLTEALALVDTTGARWCEAELQRLKGALLLQQSSDHQAEAASSLHRALDLARNQQAKSFELRAATSLARLWQQQGKRQEAYNLLAPVYHWFTEGFDTADLKDAKALLDA